MFCCQAKEYLSQKSVPFDDNDITKNAQALEELKKLGYMTTPVVAIDSSVIVGFDAEKIDTALRQTHL
jgi:glutaredoxin